MTTATAEKASVPMSEVRAWAIKNAERLSKAGLTVNPTGNLSSSVVEAYNKQHARYGKQFVRPARGTSSRPEASAGSRPATGRTTKRTG